jgi:hypothetical protein
VFRERLVVKGECRILEHHDEESLEQSGDVFLCFAHLFTRTSKRTPLAIHLVVPEDIATVIFEVLQVHIA